MLNSYSIQLTQECNMKSVQITNRKNDLIEEWISQMADFRLNLYRVSIFSLNLDNVEIC